MTTLEQCYILQQQRDDFKIEFIEILSFWETSSYQVAIYFERDLMKAIKEEEKPELLLEQYLKEGVAPFLHYEGVALGVTLEDAVQMAFENYMDTVATYERT